MWPAPSAGKRVGLSRSWFWFYFLISWQRGARFLSQFQNQSDREITFNSQFKIAPFSIHSIENRDNREREGLTLIVPFRSDAKICYIRLGNQRKKLTHNFNWQYLTLKKTALQRGFKKKRQNGNNDLPFRTGFFFSFQHILAISLSHF